MEQQVRVLPLADGEYAAEVHEGEQITHHRVTLGDLPELAGLIDVDEAALVDHTLRFLLDTVPSTAVPKEIDLGQLSREDPRYLPELRQRLTP